MEFDICVEHAGENKCFPATFIRLGYQYRIVVQINKVEIIFERDEELQWRARTETPTQISKDTQELVKLVAIELEKQLL